MLRVFAVLVILAALFAALTLWRASAREAQAEADYPPEGKIIDVNGHRVHVVVRGSGPDLVLIHGASGSTRDMTFSLAGRLEDRYRVIVIDRPGLGYTPAFNGQGETLKEQADLLQAAAAQLGADKPIVLGQSYGGAVAIAWAIYHPDNIAALVPVSAVSNLWTTPLDPLYRVTSTPFGSRFVVPLITAWVPDSYLESSVQGVFAPQSDPAGYAEYFGPKMTTRRASFRANARQRRILLDQITAQYTHNSEIKVPTEIVHGTADDTVSLTLHSVPLSQQIDGAVLTRLDGIGHMPHHVAQDAVIAAIDRAAARAGLR